MCITTTTVVEVAQSASPSKFICEFEDYKVRKVKLPEGIEKVEIQKDNQGEVVVYRPPPPPTRLPPGTTRKAHQEWLKREIRFRSTDIITTTFPKCGTTLTEQIVLLLLNQGRADQLDTLNKNIYRQATGRGKIWVEANVIPNEWKEGMAPPGSPMKNPSFLLRLDDFNAAPAPRVLKTHSSATKNVFFCHNNDEQGGYYNELSPGKYIVVTRNMFDACVSGYYHGWSPHASGWPFEAWALFWLLDETPPLCGMDYLHWHATWNALAQKYPPSSTTHNKPEILWIHYEDLIRSPKEFIAMIANFIGIEANDELLEKVMDGSSFDKMKAKAQETFQKDPSMVAGNGVAHFRKGKAGGWRNYFTPELEHLFRTKYKEVLGSSGLKYDLGNGEILE